MDHPENEALARYARGEMGREESRALERHLAACLSCQETVDGLPSRSGTVRWGGHRFGGKRREEESPESSERRDRLLGVLQALGDVLAATSESAAARLLSQPEHRRRALIRTDERFHTLDLCELLEARCRAAWFEDPAEAVEHAKLAVLIAQRLSPELYGSRRIEDVRAVAWVHLGISFRLASEGAAWVAEGAQTEGSYPLGTVGTMEIRDQGRLAEVEAGLREARESFLERGMGYDAAFVTLDLVSACLQDDRDVTPLAREAVELFEARGVDPYVIDAMRFLLVAAESEPVGVTPDLVGRMARLLQRKRGGAGERFEGDS